MMRWPRGTRTNEPSFPSASVALLARPARLRTARPEYYANEFSLLSTERERERVQLRSKLSNGVSPRRPSPSPIKQMKFLLETGNEEITGRAFAPPRVLTSLKRWIHASRPTKPPFQAGKNARVRAKLAFHSKLNSSPSSPFKRPPSIRRKETDHCSF